MEKIMCYATLVELLFLGQGFTIA